MGAFFGCMVIAVMLGLILDAIYALKTTLDARQETEVDSQRCKCQICDGQVPTMEERTK